MWWVLIRFVQAYGDLLSGLAWLWMTTKEGGTVGLACWLSLAARLLQYDGSVSDLWIRFSERSFGFCKGHSFVPLDSGVAVSGQFHPPLNNRQPREEKTLITDILFALITFSFKRGSTLPSSVCKRHKSSYLNTKKISSARARELIDEICSRI